MHLEPVPRAWQVLQVEFGGELSALRTAARKPGTATFPQHQAQRIDQDRFPGTGLTSQDRHAAVKFDLGLINDGEISDLQTGEHRSIAPLAPGPVITTPVQFGTQNSIVVVARRMNQRYSVCRFRNQ